MNRRAIVVSLAVLALGGFGTAGYFYRRLTDNRLENQFGETNTLVRPHSPILGPSDAPVTIVEFFDPSCEACRAFYPIVKQLLAKYPDDVRLVLRYAPFHSGSDEAVRILETARLQNLFSPVLEALLARQPEWASDGSPQLDKAWVAAGEAGLDLERAQKARLAPHIMGTLNQDIADGKAVGVAKTPTFFVNGKPLPSFGVEELEKLVRAEVAVARRVTGDP